MMNKIRFPFLSMMRKSNFLNFITLFSHTLDL